MSDTKTEPSHAARDKHLFGAGPKRILSLDGGGVRGAISVAFLERIEELLVQRMGPRVRLGDWFDLIGGTSTGAIIAGALALGYRASEVKEFYLRLAPKVFRPSWRRIPKLQAKFEVGALRDEIKRIVGNRTLDSPDLITGLALVTKRIDTGSPWILANNSKSFFWDIGDSKNIPNKDYALLTLLRATTAAPTYFDPEIIAITKDAPVDPLDKISGSFRWVPAQIRLFGTRLRALYGRVFPEKGPSEDTHGLFIDGGVTPYNNPAMLLLMMVTLKQFGLCWELGPKNLTIVSIGTGAFRPKLSFKELSHFLTRQITLVERAILSCICDGQNLVLAQMQWLGDCPTRWRINDEIHGLEGNRPPGWPWFRFMRYDVALDPTWLSQLGQRIDPREAIRLQSMDDLMIIGILMKLRRRAAPVRSWPQTFRNGTQR